jgi:D-arabinonate dehydratase/D-galactarolactone cycloisomerase
MSVQITDVEAIPVVASIEGDFSAPISLPNADQVEDIVFRGYRSTVIKVHTDEGVTGIGEIMTRIAPMMYKPLVENALGKSLIGMDPRDVDQAWDLMMAMMRQRGHAKGVYVEGMSGIEMALWDIVGKLKGESISRLVGSRRRDSVKAYASSLRFRDEETLREEARTYREQGYPAAKLKVGKGVETDLRNIEVVREAMGDEMDLMVDANCGYDVHTAIELGEKMEKYDISWFEEPVFPENLTGYERIADAINVPLAGGECEFTRWGFQNFLSTDAVDFIQPNVGRAGGFRECLRIADLASAKDLIYAPHTGSSSAITMAAELQIAAAVPNFGIYEHMQSDWSKEQKNPLREDLVEEDVEVYEDGEVHVPDRPGLGITLNEDVLDAHRIDQ